VICACLALLAPLITVHAEPLRVGIDVNGDPMTLVDTKGVPTGFAVELLNAIAEEMHFKVVYSAKPWEDMYEDFRAGRLDVLANITYTSPRAEIFDFAVPHMVMKGALFVRKGTSRLKSPADLRDLRVAIKLGGSAHVYLKEHNWLGQIVPAPTLRDALRAVAEGRADATMDAQIIGLKNIRDDKFTNLEASDIDVPEFAQRLHIGLQRGDTARLALINEGLARLHTNGTYDRLYEKWIGPLESHRVRLRDLQPFLLPALLVLASILGALLWQRQLLLRLKRQADALHQSEERLTLVLEGSEDGFWDWDLATGCVERSERWAAMLGYTLAEIEPTFEGGMKLVHPDDQRPRKAFETPISLGKASRFDIECRMKAKSGEWRWILNRCKVVARASDGTPLRIAGTHTDITSLKQAEEEREKLRLKMLDAQKLESLGVLAGGIAHDFNNLLTVILANATLARVEVESPNTPRDKRLADIETAARRAADLCRQMLAYAGRGSFVVERISIGKLVHDTTQLLQVSINKKARLVLNLAPDLPPVETDASQLQQVIMNLVINASEALGEAPGEISLTTRLGRPKIAADVVLHSFDLPDGACVCLEVSDTGQGMTPATLARVFDPFFTTKFAGRGLGLAAVLGIVRAHNGALTVESRPGFGSSFSLFLPVMKFTSAPATPLPAMPLPARPVEGTILVADDEPVVLSTADQLLRRAGYRTVLAADGNVAVSLFCANPQGFAAVLLDLTMPGLDGAEALRKIRAINPDVRALLMSGYSEQDVLARVRDQGPVPVLRKPFTHEMLLSRIAEVIAS